LRNCTVKSNSQQGLYINAPRTGIHLRDVTFTSNGATGIHLIGKYHVSPRNYTSIPCTDPECSLGPNFDITIVNGRFEGHTSHGIYLPSTSGTNTIRATNVEVRSNGNYGILSEGVATIILDQCNITKHSTYGLYTNGWTSAVTISNSYFGEHSGNNYWAAYIRRSALTMTNTTFENNSKFEVKRYMK
jgi:hypothetical protein